MSRTNKERETISQSLINAINERLEYLDLEALVFLSEAFTDHYSAFDSGCAGFVAALLGRMARMGLPPIDPSEIGESFLDDYRDTVKALALSVEQHDKEVAEAEAKKAAEAIQKEADFLDRMEPHVNRLVVSLAESRQRLAEKAGKLAPTVITAQAA